MEADLDIYEQAMVQKVGWMDMMNRAEQDCVKMVGLGERKWEHAERNRGSQASV